MSPTCTFRSTPLQDPAKALISSLFLSLVSIPNPVGAAALIQLTTFQSPADPFLGPTCVGTSDWLGTRFDRQDCQQAIERIITTEVDVHDRREFEFLAPHASPIHALPTMQTPRRYTGGGCSLVIAMLSSMPQGTIPELRPGSYYPADITNFEEIARAAQNIVNSCVKDNVRSAEQCGGWFDIGGRKSIGIFVWATSSMMNLRVGPSVNNAEIEMGVNRNDTMGERHVLRNGTLWFSRKLRIGVEMKETVAETS